MPRIIEQDCPNGEKRIHFWCPGCDNMMTVCPKRWSWNGDVVRPTLSPSIKQTVGPFPADTKRAGQSDVCHCFVRDGVIDFCDDSTHKLRGSHPLPWLESVIDLFTNPDGSIWWTRKNSDGSVPNS